MGIERNYIKFICSEEDKEEIKRKAVIAGFRNLSEYLRTTALNKNYVSKTDVQALFELKRIGTNLNQIAHKININNDIDFILSLENEIRNNLIDLNEIIKHIKGR